jgi:hypothetical protein
MSMVLQHAQAISILKCVIEVGEGSSRLGVLLGGLALSFCDMFFTTRGGLGT